MDTYPGTFAFVQIHHGDGYATPWGNARFNFYGTGGYPTSYFDGVIEREGAWPYTTYRNDYLARRGVATDVTIDLTAEQIGAQSFNVQADVCLEAGGTAKTMRIYMVQVLDRWPADVSYSRNGFKQAATTQDVALTAGGCQTVSRDFTFDAASWAKKDNIRIIAWAQRPLSSGPAEVYQAAIMRWPFPTRLPGCCLPNGHCTGALHNDCVAQGGDPQDPEGSCADVVCYPLKWSQPPTFNPESPTPTCFWGWDVPSAYGCVGPGCQIAADDWECTDARPITDIYWWGSYPGWASALPPDAGNPDAPGSFHLGIWSDVPSGGDPPYSHPGTLLWELTVPRTATGETGVGCDSHPDYPPTDFCFRYHAAIPEADWFYQDPGGGSTIYWLSISTQYPSGVPVIPWGWTTRVHFFNDDAVVILDPTTPSLGSGFIAGYPVEHPEGVSWDMAFTLASECPAADPPESEQQPIVAKNRSISLVPGNPGRNTALRVTLADMPAPFAGSEGCQLWVGTPSDTSESSGSAGSTPPPTYSSARLQSTPHCRDWSLSGLLSIADDEIVPGARYDVQAVDCRCALSLEDSFSIAVQVATGVWGDLVGGYESNPGNCWTSPGGYVDCWTPPDGEINFDDIAAMVDKFKNLPGAPRKIRIDVAPDVPDSTIDFTDIPRGVDAFRGLPYPFDGPDGCP